MIIWVMVALYSGICACVVLAALCDDRWTAGLIVLRGLNRWLLAAGFRRGEDWITSGGSRSKTGKARPMLRRIMKQVEVPVSQVGGCKWGMEGLGWGASTMSSTRLAGKTRMPHSVAASLGYTVGAHNIIMVCSCLPWSSFRTQTLNFKLKAH